MSVIPVVPYLSTELAGCLMSPKIIRDVRKQVRHPKLSRKKEKKNSTHFHLTTIPAVPYLPTELVGCSMGSEISCGARKQVRHLRIYQKKERKKKKEKSTHFHLTTILAIKSSYLILHQLSESTRQTPPTLTFL